MHWRVKAIFHVTKSYSRLLHFLLYEECETYIFKTGFFADYMKCKIPTFEDTIRAQTYLISV